MSGFRQAPGVVALAEQRLEAVHQGVLVGAVQRVAGLEGDHALPALLSEQLAHLAGREDVLAELGMLRLRQHAIAPPIRCVLSASPLSTMSAPGWSVRSVP
jgi:hypothetical protein